MLLESHVYKNLIDIASQNGLEFVIERTKYIDPSGIGTPDIYKIVDPKTKTTVWRLNEIPNSRLDEQRIEEASEEIRKYISKRDILTVEDFKNWLDKYATIVEV